MFVCVLSHFGVRLPGTQILHVCIKHRHGRFAAAVLRVCAAGVSAIRKWGSVPFLKYYSTQKTPSTEAHRHAHATAPTSSAAMPLGLRMRPPVLRTLPWRGGAHPGTPPPRIARGRTWRVFHGHPAGPLSCAASPAAACRDTYGAHPRIARHTQDRGAAAR